MRRDLPSNCYVAECRYYGCAVVGDWALRSKCLVAPDGDRFDRGRAAVLQKKGVFSLISIRGRRLCSFGGQVAQLPILAL